MSYKKIKSLSEIKNIVDEAKKNGKVVVTTNGAFDILHVGHAAILREAKKFGDLLIVGVNTDASVKRYKSPLRPINGENDRAEMLSNFQSVDYVFLFEEDTPVEWITLLKPDVHVKGGDYDPYNYEQMPEAKVIHEYGGKVEIVNLVAGKSTTNILKKSKEAEEFERGNSK